ncbi:MAG: NAD(P)-dependent oxidoreductase [Flavobacterium sp.]
MKFGIIKERKKSPDTRAIFSPTALIKLKQQYPDIEIKIESSDIRVFTDQQYRDLGFEVGTDMTDCDVLFGIKEVPSEYLIPNKKYFFFSHTIKKQPHNRQMLQSILEKKIDLYDYETLVDESGKRIIGFGRYAGIVGAYNGIRAFGIKFEMFNLPKAITLSGKDELITRLKRQVLPPLKIVLTGHGKVANGAMEILDGMKIKKVSVENFLTKNYSSPVYVQLDTLDYNKRIDGKESSKADFYQNPSEYTSDFERFSKVADIYMTGHFYASGAPVILTREMLNSKDCKIKVVADISCDIDGPISCTKRASSIAEPLYGYLPFEDKEVDVFHPGAIVVMAVDNLPNEIPKEASEGFGEVFMEKVLPAFFDGDKDGILEKAKITENGKLTTRFKYLQDYVNTV